METPNDKPLSHKDLGVTSNIPKAEPSEAAKKDRREKIKQNYTRSKMGLSRKLSPEEQAKRDASAESAKKAYEAEFGPVGSPVDRSSGRAINMDVEPTVADAIKGLPGHGTHHNDGEPEDQPPTYMERVYSGEYEAPEPEGSLEGINDPDFDGCLNCGAKDSWKYEKGVIGESETSRVEGYGRYCTNCNESDYRASNPGERYQEQEEENYQDFLSKHYDD